MTLAAETSAPARMQRRELSERAFADVLIAPALLFIAVIVVRPLVETVRPPFTDAMTMAHSICVLNKGRIEQFGTPMDLYHRPANRFVASFIGQPDLNFLPASVVGAGAEGDFVRGVLKVTARDRRRLADHDYAQGAAMEGAHYGADQLMFRDMTAYLCGQIGQPPRLDRRRDGSGHRRHRAGPGPHHRPGRRPHRDLGQTRRLRPSQMAGPNVHIGPDIPVGGCAATARPPSAVEHCRTPERRPSPSLRSGRGSGATTGIRK